MIEIHTVFIFLVLIFGVIGAIRGAVKEILVAFALLLALFITILLENRVPLFSEALKSSDNKIMLFWMRVIIMLPLLYFGYLPPSISKLHPKENIASNIALEKMLGFIMGCLNGFLVFGTLWYYLHVAGYPFDTIYPPPEGTKALEWVNQWMPLFPPSILGEPIIYFAIAIALTIVLAVFV